MSAVDRRLSPLTVAPTPGREREKLLQRFNALTPEHRKQLLDRALYMIGWQEDAKLTEREREIKRLIGSVERTLDLLAD